PDRQRGKAIKEEPRPVIGRDSLTPASQTPESDPTAFRLGPPWLSSGVPRGWPLASSWVAEADRIQFAVTAAANQTIPFASVNDVPFVQSRFHAGPRGMTESFRRS